MDQKEPVVISVRECSSCREDHIISFVEFNNPRFIGGTFYTHWGICPNTYEPILLTYEEGTEDE